MAFHVSVQAGVATFTLDNPPHNRLSTELVLGCAAAIEQVKADESVRVVVIRADGTRTSPTAARSRAGRWRIPTELDQLFGLGLR